MNFYTYFHFDDYFKQQKISLKNMEIHLKEHLKLNNALWF